VVVGVVGEVLVPYNQAWVTFWRGLMKSSGWEEAWKGRKERWLREVKVSPDCYGFEEEVSRVDWLKKWSRF
jgi:hypothetical protein